MSLRIKRLSTFFLTATLLAGCGGSEEFSVGNGSGDLSETGNTTTDTDTDSTNTSTVTYLPLSVYERYEAYSKSSAGDGVFQGELSSEFVKTYLINPVDASTL